MAGYGFSHAYNRASFNGNQSVRSETRKQYQTFSEFLKKRSYLSHFYNDTSDTVSLSSTSCGMAGDASHIGNQGFDYAGGMRTGALSRKSITLNDSTPSMPDFNYVAAFSRKPSITQGSCRTFPSWPKESPVSYLDERNNNFFDMTSMSNTSYCIPEDSSSFHNIDFNKKTKSSRALFTAGIHQNFSYVTREFSVSQSSQDFQSCQDNVGHPETHSLSDNSYGREGQSTNLFNEEYHDFGSARNIETFSRMPFATQEPTEYFQNPSYAPREFPKSQLPRRNNDINSNISRTNNLSQTVKNPRAFPKRDCRNDGRSKKNSELKLHLLRQLAVRIRNSKTSTHVRVWLNSAASHLGLDIDLRTERKGKHFLCHLFILDIRIATGKGTKFVSSRQNAYAVAVHKLQMPYFCISQTNPNSKELQASKKPFTDKSTSSQKASEVPSNYKQVLTRKRLPSQSLKNNKEASFMGKVSDLTPLDKFIILEPKNPMSEKNAANTLRQSATVNNMCLENEYFVETNQIGCIVRLENEILAEDIGDNKFAVTNAASFKALLKLKEFCWAIKTKNVHNKDLVSKKFVVRQEFGPSSSRTTDEFQSKLSEVLENFLSSQTDDILLFNCEFSKQEWSLIFKECRKLGLQTKSSMLRGTKMGVRIRRPFQKLFEHLMAVGGETVKYRLLSPGQHDDTEGSMPPLEEAENSQTSQSQSEGAFQESLLSPDDPDDSHDDTVQSSMKELTASLDDENEPPSESENEISESTQRKRQSDTSSHLPPPKKLKKNHSQSSTPPPEISESQIYKKAELTRAWENEKDPILKPIRGLALSIFGFTGHQVMNLKNKAKLFGIKIQENVTVSRNPLTYQITVLFDNIVMGSGPKVRKRCHASQKVYKIIKRKIEKPNLYFTEDPETNQIFLESGDEKVTIDSTEQPLLDQLKKETSFSASTFQPQGTCSNDSSPHEKRRIQSDTATFLKGVVILDSFDATPRQILNETAGFNHMPLKLCRNDDLTLLNVEMGLENHVITTAWGDTKEIASTHACDIAVDTLRQLCWCIKVKKIHTVDTVMSALDFSQNLSLSEGNMNMAKIQSFLEEYAASSSTADLVFLDNFPKKAKELIYSQCFSKLHLFCKSHKLREEKYFIVSKRVNKISLLNELKASGRETDKYKLTAPTLDPDADIDSLIQECVALQAWQEKEVREKGLGRNNSFKDCEEESKKCVVIEFDKAGIDPGFIF